VAIVAVLRQKKPRFGGRDGIWLIWLGIWLVIWLVAGGCDDGRMIEIS
jgi:hypothetical protein